MQSASLLSRRAAVLGVLVLLATAFGGWRAVTLAATPHLAGNSFRVGGVTYTITHAEQVQGLSDSELSGMGHGIQGLVNEQNVLVRVWVTVTAGDTRATYRPGVLQAYRAGSSVAVPAAGGSLPGGTLAAHARIDGQLSYVVPRDGKALTMRAGADPREVSLVQLDARTPGVGGTHAHPSPVNPK